MRRRIVQIAYPPGAARCAADEAKVAFRAETSSVTVLARSLLREAAIVDRSRPTDVE